jgi:two-component system nitrate/nitrite response regulator NarL
MIRTLIADDHAMFREGLRRVLEADSTLEIVGEAKDGVEVIQLSAKLKPQVLLLDMQMPKQTGLESLPEIARLVPQARIIFLIASMDTNETIEALRIGARGIVMKDQATAILVDCIHAVVAGDYCVGTKIVHNLQDYLARLIGESRRMRFGLTDREIDVVSAIVSGYSNKEMAKKLQISEDTVKHHMSKIFDKTGVSSRLELALFAKHHKIPLRAML